jgi:hypothetical protein
MQGLVDVLAHFSQKPRNFLLFGTAHELKVSQVVELPEVWRLRSLALGFVHKGLGIGFDEDSGLDLGFGHALLVVDLAVCITG